MAPFVIENVCCNGTVPTFSATITTLDVNISLYEEQ
jgi:hypothetical protein